MRPELSVVVPVYNEEDVLPLLVQRLRPVLDGLATDYEVVAVDDGSVDASPVIMQRIRREWPEFRVIRLRANAGHQAAISAGLARARGDYVVTIDADLQDPPEVVEQMLHIARSEGADVVYGVRGDRSTDTAFKRGTARAFYATMRAVSNTSAPADAGDFRLMSRATVDAVNALPEHHRVLRLVVPALGFPSAQVTYRRGERAAGSSKYPLSKMIKLSFDSVTSQSMAPLRLATWFGLIGGVFAVLIFVYAIVSSAMGRANAGWTSTVAAVSSVGAVQLVCLGLLGEYVGRMFTMMQGRPTYFVAHDTIDGRTHDEDDDFEDEEEFAHVHRRRARASRPTVEVRREPAGKPPGTGSAEPAAPQVTASTLAGDRSEPAVASNGVDHDQPARRRAEPARSRDGLERRFPAKAGGSGQGVGATAVSPSARQGGFSTTTAVEENPLGAAERQAVRRTSASRVTPGSDFTGR